MSKTQSNREKLLPLGATARVFHVEPAWLRSEAEAKRIPHIRAGRVLLFSPKVVERVLMERLRQADGEGVTQ